MFKELRILGSLLGFFLLSSASVWAVETMYIVETNVVEELQVNRHSVYLHVPNMRVTFQVSDRVPLIQQTEKHYIAAIKGFDGTFQLAAFPKQKSRREGTGWVTNDKYLIFANKTQSVSGHLELRMGERLILINEHPDHYEALLHRYGRDVVVRIPEGMGGVSKEFRKDVVRRLIPVPEPELAVSEEEQKKTSRRSSRPARKISVTFDDDGIVIEDEEGNEFDDGDVIDADTAGTMQAARIEFGGPTKRSRKKDKAALAKDQVIQELKEVVMLELAAELQKSKADMGSSSEEWDSEDIIARANGDMGSSEGLTLSTDGEAESGGESLPVESGVDDEVETDQIIDAVVESKIAGVTDVLDGATDKAVETAVAGHSEFKEDQPVSLLKILDNYSLIFQILLGVCILEGVLLFNMRMKNKQAGKAETSSEAYTYNAGEETMVSAAGAAMSEDDGDLTGSLDGYSMGQVVQFFNSSGDSGELTLKGTDGQHDTMYFQEGQIIDAVCGELRGEEAVYGMLKRQQGSFSFRRKDLSAHDRVILQDTMSILLEGHRLVDEMGYVEG